MRKQFFAITSVTAAAVAVLSCAKVAEIKDEALDNNAAKGFTVNVRAGEDMTRTMAVDGDVPSIEWSINDFIALIEVVDGQVVSANYSESAIFDEEGRASFITLIDWDDIGTPGTSTYQYSAVYPGHAVRYISGQYLLYLPEEQNLVGNNFSEDSDILISTVLDHGNTRVTQDEDLMFPFRRVGTVVRLRLKGIPEGETISKVTLQAPEYIAGSIVYDPVTGNVDPETAFQDYAYNRITLIPSDLVATGDDVIWFRVMCDEDWAAGEEFVIQVDTDQGVYQKEVTLPVDIRFPDGGLTKFGVDLSDSLVPLEAVYIFQDDFESGNSWSFFDKDGDRFEWLWFDVAADFAHSGVYALLSRSYENSGAVRPDNYAFTPAIRLTTDNYLSFWVSASDVYPSEHYAVYVTTEAPSDSNLPTSNPIFEQTYSTSATVEGNLVELGPKGYQHYVIPLAGYAGQTVYIGFRHFDSYNQYYLLLDDVAVTEGAPVSASAPPHAAPKRVAAPKVHGSSIRKDAPKAQVSFIGNEIRKSR